MERGRDPFSMLTALEQCIVGSVGMDRVPGEQLELTVLSLSLSAALVTCSHWYQEVSVSMTTEQHPRSVRG